ncbi:hypothetical protein CSUB01_02255 [Colletotrichum sublineola]|uniref:D-glycerate 3-kinase n=1 Tax=Colletotrichum sublineola TaxID=1173701 RepID=A0A066X061_COLSU|nr:hypothetical protein CSUB01_02255 [Colletotrichum sublineola]
MIDAAALDAVIQHVLPHIKSHIAESSGPFVLGLSGLQGSGKSTWAAAKQLSQTHSTRNTLVALRESNPCNGLFRTRGQPGTHDEALARHFFDDVFNTSPAEGTIKWPAFDKSLFGGEGGRVPIDKWETVPRSPPLEVLIFEGWCLGFQPLSDAEVEQKWLKAKEQASTNNSENPQFSTMTLASHALEHLLVVNKNLQRYCDSFMGPWRFDAFLHLSTDQLINVYHWRLDQEKALREKKGTGMTDAEVVRFVQGYMPAYELYLDKLAREPFFPEQDGRKKAHVHVVLDSDRNVLSVEKM